MKTKKKFIKIGILIIILIFSGYARAFGISYIFGKPITLYPGETKDIYFTIQNFAGGQNITIKATIAEGFEIAKITDSNDTYFIPFDGEKKVNVKLNVPENAKIGNRYNLIFSFDSVKENAAGGMGLATSMEKRIDVVIVAPLKEAEKLPTEKILNIQIIIIAIIIIVIIVIILSVLKKEKIKKIKLNITFSTN